MKLLTQPDDGIAPLISAIQSAKKSIEIFIFRLDWNEIEAALKAAVKQGVFVHALIAHTNRGGEKQLRNLELRLLEAGASVARTAGDLIRYHYKMIIVDRRILYVLSFNFTRVDIQHCRGFGIATDNRKLVQEAVRLFEADSARKPYSPRLDTFVVSPETARKQLGAFLKKARKELLIYDPKVNDPEMIRLLQDRARAGVEIRIIGRLGKNSAGLSAQKLGSMLLHTRTIIRDRSSAFVGSQSLRPAELDSRREVGLIVDDPGTVKSLIATFEADWATTDLAQEQTSDKKEEKAPAKEHVEKVVETLSKELPSPIASTVKKAVRKAVAETGEEILEDDKVKEAVTKAVKKAAKQAVNEVVQETQQPD